MNQPLQAIYTEGSVSQHLRTMAVPLLWGLIATMSFNFVDTLFVAQLGEDQLAAMTFTFPVVFFITSMAIGLGAGASSAIARAVGAGDGQRVKRLVTDSCVLVALISVSVCVLGWFTIDSLFIWLGASPELLPYIHDYMAIWYISAPFLMVPMVALSALRSLGYARIQGVVMSAAAVLNSLLDPIFIFGWFGVPRLEIEGAAIATLIVRVMTLLVAFYVMAVNVKIFTNPFAHWRVMYQSWRVIFHVAIPATISNVIIPMASAIVVNMVAAYGKVAVAGLGVAMRIEPLALIVFYALSGVVGPFSGQNYGANRHQRVQETLSVVTRFCLLSGIALMATLWLLRRPISTLFGGSEEVVEVAALYLSLVPFSYGAYGIVMSVNAMFNGLGRPAQGMVISMLRVLIVFLPVAFICKWLWGLTGIFLAAAISNLLVGAIAYIWLRQSLRRDMDTAGVPQASQNK